MKLAKPTAARRSLAENKLVAPERQSLSAHQAAKPLATRPSM